MDQPGMEPDSVLKELTGSLDAACIPLPDTDPGRFDAETAEALAVCDDRLLEQYLEQGQAPSAGEIAALIAARKLFPVYFGSALKNTGVDALLRGLSRYTAEPMLPDTFSAKVFKISRDTAGTRLAWMRVLGGKLPPYSRLTSCASIPGTVSASCVRLRQDRSSAPQGSTLYPPVRF